MEVRVWSILQYDQRGAHAAVIFAPNKVDTSKLSKQIQPLASSRVIFTWKTANIQIHFFQQTAKPTVRDAELARWQWGLVNWQSPLFEIVLFPEASLRNMKFQISKNMGSGLELIRPIIDPLHVVVYDLLCSGVIFLGAVPEEKQSSGWHLKWIIWLACPEPTKQTQIISSPHRDVCRVSWHRSLTRLTWRPHPEELTVFWIRAAPTSAV